MALFFLATFLAIAQSACDLAEVSAEATGSIDYTTVWSGSVGIQISPGSCISLWIEGFTKYSGKWECMTDGDGKAYLQYNLYSGVTDCSGSPMTFNAQASFDTVFNVMANIPNAFNAIYVFESKAQAKKVLVRTSVVLGVTVDNPTDTIIFGFTRYYIGSITCGGGTNCGASITKTIYNNADGCSGSIVAQAMSSDVVTGICAIKANAVFNLGDTCDVLDNAGIINKTMVAACKGTSYTAAYSVGFYCKENALWIITYNNADCATDNGSFAVRINPVCYKVGLHHFQLAINCGNPGALGALSSDGMTGDQLEGVSGANQYGLFYALFIAVVVYMFQ